MRSSTIIFWLTEQRAKQKNILQKRFGGGEGLNYEIFIVTHLILVIFFSLNAYSLSLSLYPRHTLPKLPDWFVVPKMTDERFFFWGWRRRGENILLKTFLLNIAVFRSSYIVFVHVPHSNKNNLDAQWSVYFPREKCRIENMFKRQEKSVRCIN